jgi:simple sugar transport system permease protein
VATQTGSLALGVLGGIGGGLLCGVVMAVLAVDARADQILVGIGINLLALGATSFLNAYLFNGQASTTLSTIGTARIPGLADLGNVGRALFDREPGVYAGFVLLTLVWLALFRTNWGIALRAVGEDPFAADAAGVSVRGMRWAGVLVAAGLSGLAGAELALGEVGVFTNGMTAGRGYLALAAVLFGRWRPLGVLGACILFAGTTALQLRLQGLPSVPGSLWFTCGLVLVAYALLRSRRGVGFSRTAVGGGTTLIVAVVAFAVLWQVRPAFSVSSQLWLASPFILALFALAVAGEGRTAMPSKLAVPYERGEG